MEGRTKVAIAIIIVLSSTLPVFASGFKRIYFRGFNSPPEPRLIYPISDKVILTGKDFLEFRWWNDFIGIEHYEFKLYKGYNMYASDLIYKQSLPSRASSIKIKSELFEDGQVYTWSLIQVSFGGQKSDKSFNSFKVIKK